MRFEIKGIEPMGAVRTTRRQKFVDPRAQRYMEYKQKIYYEIINQLNGVYAPIDAAVGVTVRFKMPIPSSWSKKQKEAAVNAMHTKKPDIDNLIKGLFDSLNGLLFIDDNRVSQMMVTKVYSNDPGIDLIIDPIGELSHGQAKTKPKEVKQASKGEKAPGTRRDISKRL